VYRDIEECETWDEIISTIHKGLKPHIKHLLRKVTDEDVTRLTEIRIKRISKFDGFKADEKIASLEGEIEEVKHNLQNLTDYAIAWYKRLKKTYGEGRGRKTEIKTFEKVDAAKVAVINAKLQANYEEGFVGIGMKRDEGEFVCDCSDIDDIIIFRKDGKMLVTKVSTKAFVGKNIIHVRVWKKGDSRTIYNMMYRDGKSGPTRMKRFAVTSITRDKEYDLTKGTAGTEVLYFTANPNGEAETVTIYHRQLQRLKKLKFDVDFSELAIKGRGAGGNIVTKHPVKKVELKEKGVSTLGARKIWFDPTVQRLNVDERGRFLGDFYPDDKILVLLSTGEYKLIGFDLSTHFEDTMIHLEKWLPEKPLSCVYYDGDKENWFVKRFLVEQSTKKVNFITDHENSRLGVVSTLFHPVANVRFNKKFKHTRDKEDEQIELNDFISVKGIKALGNKLSQLPVTEVNIVEPDEEKEQNSLNELLAARQVEPEQSTENDNDESPEANNSEGDSLSKESVTEKTQVSSKGLKPKDKGGQKPVPKASIEKSEGVPDEVSEPIELSVDTDPEEDGQIPLF
ncbi:MAG: DNA gyrase/topoisomerase IV subunit A, partial [Flavobacteriales bacterium]|nr:DNA gyrase/topoisomerase IV subunit A [Flavobacteriales bacterium]